MRSSRFSTAAEGAGVSRTCVSSNPPGSTPEMHLPFVPGQARAGIRRPRRPPQVSFHLRLAQSTPRRRPPGAMPRAIPCRPFGAQDSAPRNRRCCRGACRPDKPRRGEMGEPGASPRADGAPGRTPREAGRSLTLPARQLRERAHVSRLDFLRQAGASEGTHPISPHGARNPRSVHTPDSRSPSSHTTATASRVAGAAPSPWFRSPSAAVSRAASGTAPRPPTGRTASPPARPAVHRAASAIAGVSERTPRPRDGRSGRRKAAPFRTVERAGLQGGQRAVQRPRRLRSLPPRH